MKKLLLLSVIIFTANISYGMYDFCESPADYNTFPQAYDVRTEYWKNIPNYNSEDDIKFGNMENKNPTNSFNLKKPTKKQTKINLEK